jgi:hypothetical protein
MRVLNGVRSLNDLELHLTDGEAEGLVAALVECRDDLAKVGMSESHAPVAGGESDVTVYVYASEEELEAEVSERMRDDS